MKTPFRKLSLTVALCLLCAAAPATHAASYARFDGVKGESPPAGVPQTWHWFVTPIDPSGSAGVSVAVGDVTGDGMDAVTVALLLPAVQKVREAAAQWPGSIPLDLSQPLSPEEVALLLPAVQKVREAASALPDPSSASMMELATDLDPVSIGLLLPAVQKVREAAVMSLDLTGAPAWSDEDFFRFLLPATSHAADVADRIPLANLTLPSLLGLPGSDDPQMRFATDWQLMDGQVLLRMEGSPIPAVPEPSTWALWLGALGMAGLLRRQRGANADLATA